jgi:uncharacterized protein
MCWATLWALVLGFLLSGAVQRFVSTDAMQRRLGDHSWRSVTRAASYGAASSSCSYAAAATSRSLLAKGADAVSSFVFMVASTNLVIELGAVILGLLGWRFLAGQLLGGVVLVVVLALLGGLALRGRALAAGRSRLAASASEESGHCHAGPEPAAATRAAGVVSLEGWSEAAGLGLADATMVRRELLFGFALAGIVSVVVSDHAWSVLFFHGHGVLTTVENALAAPVIAALSCVCSVGNVPLAAALWRGGLGFVGTLAFLFADVLALPLVLIYRRYFGARLTLRLVAVLYVAIVVAALVVGGVLEAVGLAPSSSAARVAPVSWRPGAVTTALNVASLALVAVLLAVRGRRRRATSLPESGESVGQPTPSYGRAG